MEIYTIILLAIGLASDALAVAVAHGAGAVRFRLAEAIKMAALFGIFQGIMPVFGWLVGLSFKTYITSVDHWIAFFLLSVIGFSMIYQDWFAQDDSEEVIEETEAKSIWTIIALAVATSIDALVVGISFIVLHSIVLPVVLVGIITFVLCAAGYYFGHQYKHLAGKKVNTVGGVILILIGLKILVEHLMH